MFLIVAALSLCALLCAYLLKMQQIDSLVWLPKGYRSNVSSKANSLEQKLDQKTDKPLASVRRPEEEIFRKPAPEDFLAVLEVMGNVAEDHDVLRIQISDEHTKMLCGPFLNQLAPSLKILDGKTPPGSLAGEL